MAKNIGTFDLRQVAFSFGGIPVEGYAAGDSISIEEENDVFNSEGGADGHVDRIKNNVNWLNITVRLQQTSPVNQLLSAQHNLDRLTGKAILPILIKDGGGNTLISAENAWIAKHPAMGYGNESKPREWKFKTDGNYIINLDGNS